MPWMAVSGVRISCETSEITSFFVCWSSYCRVTSESEATMPSTGPSPFSSAETAARRNVYCRVRKPRMLTSRSTWLRSATRRASVSASTEPGRRCVMFWPTRPRAGTPRIAPALRLANVISPSGPEISRPSSTERSAKLTNLARSSRRALSSLRVRAFHSRPLGSQPRDRETGPPSAQWSRFGVFQKRIEGGHVGDDEAFQAVEEASLENVGFDEIPGRVEDQAPQGHGDFAGGHFLRGEGGIAVERFEMLGEGFAGEVQDVVFEISDVPLGAHAFMHEIAHPPGFAAVVEADFAIRIPAAVVDPASQIAGQAGHGVGVEARAGFLQVQDFGLQRFAERLIGVEGEDPLVSGLLGGPILLAGVAAPSGLDHAGPEVGGEFHGAVGGSAIQDEDLIAAAEAFDGAGDIAFFVERDDGGRDLHHRPPSASG